MQYKNGHLYGLNLDLSYYSSIGIIGEYLYDTNTETGVTTYNHLDDSSQLNLAAVETAQATDGTVYGEFYGSDLNTLEWGTVDYSTQTRTTIGPATHIFVALGITKAGQLYGVATDGNLYSIDKSTGTETLVGATGLNIADSDGSYYIQSGEINQNDDVFYWAALQANGTGGLYEVNLQTGAATQIDGQSNELFGMYIPAAEASDDAPARVEDASLSFEDVSLSGRVTFTAPSKTFAGNALTGSLTYTVRANDQVVATGTATAGSAVSVDVTVPNSGNYDFAITTSNDAGESPRVQLTKWIGSDVPNAVTGLNIINNGGVVTITWNPSTTGAHNGVIGAVSYDVYRIAGSDTTLVASDLTDTYYRDVVGKVNLAYYTYAVQAKSDGQKSGLTTSDGILLGDAIEPNWTENFDNPNDFNLFTVKNPYDDGRSWRYDSSEGAVHSYWRYRTGNDDWLFTPPLHLTPNRLYTVAFKIRNNSKNYANSLEVKWGNDTTAEAMNNTLLETTTPGEEYTTYSYDISVPSEGKYYIGFHDNTPTANQLWVYVDSIVVAKGALGTAPQAVSELTVTPAAKGALSADLSFIIPSKTIDGSDLNSVDSIQIRRDGTSIAVLPRANAGTVVRYTDSAVPSSGYHKYEISAYLGNEEGQKTSATTFVGVDIPNNPANVEFIDNQENILANWSPFTEAGPNGGYVDPSQVSVSFYKINQDWIGYSVGDSVTTSAPGATSTTIPQNPEETTDADGHTQALYQLITRANGPTGNSDYTISDAIVVGPSIPIPFRESLSDGSLDNGFAWVDNNDQVRDNETAATWNIDTQNSSDGDGGSLLWHAYTDEGSWSATEYTVTPGDEVYVNMPKVSLKGSTTPKLIFSLNATVNDPAQLKVIVQTPDGVNHEAETYELSTTTTAGWQVREVDLTPYASQRYVNVKFLGIAEGEDAYIGLDDINIFNQLSDNLMAFGINAPNSITAGKTANIDVYVKNFGSQPVYDYDVVLYSDNQPVDTVSVNDELNVLETDTVTLKLPVAINRTENLNVKAVIDFVDDQNADDNNTENKTIVVNPSEYTKVNDLKALADDNAVNLEWTKPLAPDPVQVTEDFESYEPFATELGDWTLVDGDKGFAGNFYPSYSYPGEGTAFAFDAFNPTLFSDGFNVVENNPGMTPHSGNQFAGAPYATDDTGRYPVDEDNWLISPELSTKKQTIKFYVFNVASDEAYGSSTVYRESFDVLYSTTTRDTANFVKIESDVADGTSTLSQGANWKELNVELPEGARYFAIHHTSSSNNSFLFGIDDVSFVRSAVGGNDTIIAYNIYRDGELIGTVNGNAVTFADEKANEGSHTYNVTVVYRNADGELNESGFSNDATIEVVSGIDSITANAEGTYDVYTLDGKTVMIGSRSLKGLKRGIYIINDRKYIIK